MNKFFAFIILLFLAFCLGGVVATKTNSLPPTTVTHIDTIRVDSIIVDTVYKDKVVYDYLPMFVKGDTITDTLTFIDTVFVQIPIQQYIARDTNYYVEVEGYKVKFKKIEFYPDVEIVVEDKDRWSLGVQTGYGMGKNGLQPYIGVGLSYNFITW